MQAVPGQHTVRGQLEYGMTWPRVCACVIVMRCALVQARPCPCASPAHVWHGTWAACYKMTPVHLGHGWHQTAASGAWSMRAYAPMCVHTPAAPARCPTSTQNTQNDDVRAYAGSVVRAVGVHPRPSTCAQTQAITHIYKAAESFILCGPLLVPAQPPIA